MIDGPPDQPLACALLGPEFRARKAAITEELFAHVLETRELEDGFAYRLPGEGPWSARVFAFVEAERVCCPFFRFEVVLEPDGGPLWLSLRGGDGVKAFIAGVVGGEERVASIGRMQSNTTA